MGEDDAFRVNATALLSFQTNIANLQIETVKLCAFGQKTVILLFFVRTASHRRFTASARPRQIQFSLQPRHQPFLPKLTKKVQRSAASKNVTYSWNSLRNIICIR